jgi:hypothetical protein
MDLSDPTRAVTPTLDGTVLAVLAVAGKPLTVGQVAQQAARGSEIGIRRSLARLVEQGIVRATLMGRNQVHELNRDHLAAPVADVLAGLRSELWRRFRDELGRWDPRPLYACVFGSAARGDGDVSSDIDLLLVHPTLALRTRSGAEAVERWPRQLDDLRALVHRWTGNQLQVVDLSLYEWRHAPKTHERLLADVERDGVELVRSRALPRSGAADG